MNQLKKIAFWLTEAWTIQHSLTRDQDYPGDWQACPRGQLHLHGHGCLKAIALGWGPCLQGLEHPDEKERRHHRTGRGKIPVSFCNGVFRADDTPLHSAPLLGKRSVVAVAAVLPWRLLTSSPVVSSPHCSTQALPSSFFSLPFPEAMFVLVGVLPSLALLFFLKVRDSRTTLMTTLKHTLFAPPCNQKQWRPKLGVVDMVIETQKANATARTITHKCGQSPLRRTHFCGGLPTFPVWATIFSRGCGICKPIFGQCQPARSKPVCAKRVSGHHSRHTDAKLRYQELGLVSPQGCNQDHNKMFMKNEAQRGMVAKEAHNIQNGFRNYCAK